MTWNNVLKFKFKIHGLKDAKALLVIKFMFLKKNNFIRFKEKEYVLVKKVIGNTEKNVSKLFYEEQHKNFSLI